MRKVFFLTVLTITCALNSSAQVINYEIDDTFNSELLFTRGSVSDILLNQFDNYMITGMFSATGPSPINSGAIVAYNGNLISESNFGGLWVSHYQNSFLQYGYAIRKYDQNGIDYSFRFEFQKQAYSGPLSNKALDAMVVSDDNILVAGRFFTDSTLMGTNIASQGLRQLCMVDSTGAPVPDFPMLRCEWPTNSEIRTIHQLSTGEYIIAGTFHEVDGHPYAKLAKLNPDFSVNTDFGHVFGTSGDGVSTTLIDSQDRIWVIFGPNMTILNHPDYTSRNIRILPNGTIDTTFSAPVCTYYTSGTYEDPIYSNPFWPNTIAAGVIEDEDGTFILRGSFIEVNGEHRRRLAKITDAGELIPGAFEFLGADSATWPEWNGTVQSGPVMGAGIRMLKKLPDGKLLIGGQFSSFGGEPYSCLVRLQPAGFVGTDDRAGRGTLKLYPNPARDHFRIEVPEGAERLQTVEICDMQGRTVRTWPASRDPYPTGGLPAGMYVVRAGGKDGVFTQKIVLDPW